MVTLLLTEKGGETKQLNFDKDEVTIGRVQGNDVVLPKGNVSTEALPPPPGVKGQSAAPPARPPVQPSATAVIGAGEAKPIDLDKQPLRQVPVKASAIYVQAGAFTQFENAHRLSARISSIAPATVSTVNVKGTEFFRVRIGPLESVEAADRTLAQVIATGQPEARIVID